MDIAVVSRQDGRAWVCAPHIRYLGGTQAKKNALKPWRIKSWCIPKVSTRFIAKMEDVLTVYERPYDPLRPVVCLDEKGKELQAHPPAREPLPPKPGIQGGQGLEDYEYKRQGCANIFLACEPLGGWRRTQVTQERTALTFATQLKQLVDEDFPDADKVVLVTDNLNIHGVWSLYEAFAPQEAKRIADKLEWHYTPEHGSWLNMAELELSALGRQCLNRRIPDAQTLAAECNAWCIERNTAQVTINWHFSASDARIKLRRLYPVIT
ncbi:MAG TPA: IS630 family transposase [Chloroflexia bacterium]